MGERFVFVLLPVWVQTIHQVLIATLFVTTGLIGDAERVVSHYTQVITPSENARRSTQMLMDIYQIYGEDGIDQYLETMDDSWFSGIDVYLSEDASSLIRSIEEDSEAQFKTNRRAAITVDSANRDYLVVIYSFP